MNATSPMNKGKTKYMIINNERHDMSNPGLFSDNVQLNCPYD